MPRFLSLPQIEIVCAASSSPKNSTFRNEKKSTKMFKLALCLCYAWCVEACTCLWEFFVTYFFAFLKDLICVNQQTDLYLCRHILCWNSPYLSFTQARHLKSSGTFFHCHLQKYGFWKIGTKQCSQMTFGVVNKLPLPKKISTNT